MSEQSTYKITVTFKSGKLVEKITDTYPKIQKRVKRYYERGHLEMGKAEAVELELIVKH